MKIDIEIIMKIKIIVKSFNSLSKQNVERRKISWQIRKKREKIIVV